MKPARSGLVGYFECYTYPVPDGTLHCVIHNFVQNIFLLLCGKVSHLLKPEKRAEATPLATTKRLCYRHCEARAPRQSHQRSFLEVAQVFWIFGFRAIFFKKSEAGAHHPRCVHNPGALVRVPYWKGYYDYDTKSVGQSSYRT